MPKSASPSSDLPKLSAPAHRALAAAGITHLKQLSKISESELGKLHGIGPNAIRDLHTALAAKGLSFAADKKNK